MRIFTRQVSGIHAFIAGVFLILSLLAVSVFHEMSLVARESAQLALMKETDELLDAYFAKHGRFPPTLNSLNFTYPDGGDPSIIPLFKYETDGQIYTLNTRGIHSDAEYMHDSRSSKTNR